MSHQLPELPEDILLYISRFLHVKTLILYTILNKLIYKFINKKNITNDAINAKWGNKLMLFYSILEKEPTDLRLGVSKMLGKRFGDPYDSNFVRFKSFSTRHIFTNLIFNNEELRLWSPRFPTGNFEKNRENWIALMHLGSLQYNNIKYKDRAHETIARTIQHMKLLIQTQMPRVNEVILVGGNPHLPFSGDCLRIKMYCKWCDQFATPSQPWKKRKIEGIRHIPTEYIDKRKNTIRKSYHALQCMKLEQGSTCSVRMGFNIFPHGRNRWQWFMRINFDKVRIYI
tara:strand:- start:167 stop:1021 length:855 start_codon:yes stop_codon:yes gene_type:complete